MLTLQFVGATQSLMTLWSVLNHSTAAVMKSSYSSFLSDPNQEVAALGVTKIMFRWHDNLAYSRCLVWALFGLKGA